VAHACNPSYSEGRDQEDCSSKPAQANRSRDPISKKNPSQKRAGGVAQGEGLQFKPQYQEIIIIIILVKDTVYPLTLSQLNTHARRSTGLQM
jgi:hypothetical protein